MVRRCYLKSSLVTFLKKIHVDFTLEIGLLETQRTKLSESLEIWAAFIITIHTLQERCLYKQQYYDEV